MARAFVAVTLPEPVLDAVDAATAGLELPDARRTPREQWHLTLQFLGNHVDLDATAAALETLDAPAGRLGLGGAGAFPKPARATVLWIGLREGVLYLSDLAERVSRATGVPLEHRPHRPHLTIARPKRATDVRGVVAALDPTSLGDAWDVTDITLFESVLGSSGARHTPVRTIALRR
ncbi:MAG TPA: RNA 2',3'-cyclic phosphodiesterase [Acidimicrobiia bacterium]|nr:RNA 2',3'-cyclic phosphodiesterase [Acidimicrobiia bacterium]